MARERYTLYAPSAPGGYELTDGWVRDVETREDLLRTPDRRGEDSPGGQGHGNLWSPKVFEAGGFIVRLWMLATLSRPQVDAWYDELLRVATWPYDLVRVVRRLADGSERECLAELVTSVEPEPLGNLGMRLGLEWGVPGGFWQDTTDRTSQQALAASGTALTFPEFAGATAPMATLQVTIAGPVTGPIRLTQPLTRQWVEVTGNIAAGASVTLDCATGAITGVSGGAVRYSGATFLEMPPLPATVPLTLVATHNGAGSGSYVRLTGRRRWLA